MKTEEKETKIQEKKIQLLEKDVATRETDIKPLEKEKAMGEKKITTSKNKKETLTDLLKEEKKTSRLAIAAVIENITSLMDDAHEL